MVAAPSCVWLTPLSCGCCVLAGWALGGGWLLGGRGREKELKMDVAEQTVSAIDLTQLDKNIIIIKAGPSLLAPCPSTISPLFPLFFLALYCAPLSVCSLLPLPTGCEPCASPACVLCRGSCLPSR